MELFAWIIAIYIWLTTNPLIAICLYLLPVIVALLKSHKSVVMIIVLDLLFGWIFPLWFIVLLWAILGERGSPNNDMIIDKSMTPDQEKRFNLAKDREQKAKERMKNMYD